ncbi:hypothetical protein K7I13_14340 [Brucepastera parasyntrophica]|uniref:hypothetical protein n=1 Tax=Brucepastera parasyntrophica TaxID=2880008 RepID=UPI002109DD1B|nr:hypothetical protein [Brucepastera parasyntrophica]ULQ59620.1 hypothetical protein K7I13_14340 [Brucepastera parasyntrophica]
MREQFFRRIIPAVFILLVCGCKTTGSAIKSAPLGNGFSISNEKIYHLDGTFMEHLTLPVVASINGIIIANGAIEDGKLSIDIPASSGEYPELQNDNDMAMQFTLLPDDLMTGTLELSSIMDGNRVIIKNCEYNTQYQTLTNIVSYVYASTEAEITGMYRETEYESGNPVHLIKNASIHYLPGWNRLNTRLTFSAADAENNMYIALTTDSVKAKNKWYIALEE